MQKKVHWLQKTKRDLKKRQENADRPSTSQTLSSEGSETEGEGEDDAYKTSEMDTDDEAVAAGAQGSDIDWTSHEEESMSSSEGNDEEDENNLSNKVQ